MNISLTQRCLFHPSREAVARCPGCGRFFCRECISEHDDVVLCATCLSRAARVGQRRRSIFGQLSRALLALLGLFVAWYFFDLMGRGLMKLPASVHEGTIWQELSSE